MICFMPIVIGPKYAVRISDLQDDFALQFNCWVCDHVAIMPATYFKMKFEPYKRIIDIEHVFQCGKCGNKIENRWLVVRQVRQDQPKAPAVAAEGSREDPEHKKGCCGSSATSTK